MTTITQVIHLDDDPVRRNLLITQSYHDLSSALADQLGRENANWCTFATWASRTAGTFIRDEEIPRVVRLFLGKLKPVHVSLARLNDTLAELHEDARFDHGGVVDAIKTTIHDVSQLIAAGNLAVYGELAPLFENATVALAADRTPHALDEVIASLRPGLSQQGGQALLASAFRTYARARNQHDVRRKAALMLLANAQVGLHEQIRLQPFIAGSIDAPISDAVADALAHIGRDLPRPIAHEVHAVLSHAIHPIADSVQALWQRVATHELMTLDLPDTKLLLGHDLPAPPGEPLYPEVLDPIGLPAVREVFISYGAIDKLRHGRGAHDWTRLSERMRYILELFRSRQRDPRLMTAPG